MTDGDNDWISAAEAIGILPFGARPIGKPGKS